MGVSWCRGAEVEAITQGTVNLRDDAVDVVFVVVAMPRWATLIEGCDAIWGVAKSRREHQFSRSAFED